MSYPKLRNNTKENSVMPTTELERAAQINADIMAADKARKDAEEGAANHGEKLDNILKHLDSLGKRMDAFEKKPVEEAGEFEKLPREDSDDERTAKSYPPSSMNPINDDPDAARPLGADSVRKDSAADSEEIAHFKKENGVARPIAADSVLAAIQSDADRASTVWGKSAPHPWDGEKIVAYRRRTAREHQSHSPAWKDVDLNMLSGQTLRNAAAQIFSDSIAASSSSKSYGETLREVRRRDPDTGHLIKEYYGEPRAWMRQFAGGPPRLARFNLDAFNRR
jgi:hypothetical protein